MQEVGVLDTQSARHYNMESALRSLMSLGSLLQSQLLVLRIGRSRRNRNRRTLSA